MTSKEKERITLRLPRELSRVVKEKAKEMGISANAYIAIILSRELTNKN